MKIGFTTLLYLTPILSWSQTHEPPSMNEALNEFGFIQEQIISQEDTITYFLKSTKEKSSNLVVFIQGTDANPMFSYTIRDHKNIYYRWFPDDYQHLDKSYTYAVIPKPGMEKLYNEKNIEIPQCYYERNYLDYRVRQVDHSIRHIIEHHLTNPGKIVVYGHSEGAAIGAALATTNEYITHLGFWSGNVLNNFYEFSLFNRIEALKGQLTDQEAHQNILEIIAWYQSVINNPNSAEIDHFGFTNKRWSTYEKAPIDYLTILDIPIYALFGTEDESTPIETAYLLPVKFIEHRKENLTFEVCMGCDHTYQEVTEKGTQFHWEDQFIKFIEWVENKDQ